MKPISKKLAASIFACVAWVVFSASAKAQDSWTGEDKKMHFLVSASFGVAAGAHWPEDKWKAFGAAMVPGVVKELIDAGEPGNKFSGKDLVWDAIGAAFGVNLGSWMVRRDNGVTMVMYRSEF